MKTIFALLFLFFQGSFASAQEIDSVLYQNLLPLKQFDKTIEVDYIFYIGETSKQEKRILRTVARFLIQYPTINIEIQVHTDMRGTKAYNRKISQKTAEEIRTDLVVLGVDSSRLIAKGMGEVYPLIDCKNVNCNEDQHRMNRRIELRRFRPAASKW